MKSQRLSVRSRNGSHYVNQSINQSIYLLHYVGWGCPEHPSQKLMYKTKDNKNT